MCTKQSFGTKQKHNHCSTQFMRDLRAAFGTSHYTLDTLWALLLGDKIPSKLQQKVLLAHFQSHGWDVTPRDFIRGTAASNHPMFINLRLLRHNLSRSELEIMFFGQPAKQLKGLSNAD